MKLRGKRENVNLPSALIVVSKAAKRKCRETDKENENIHANIDAFPYNEKFGDKTGVKGPLTTDTANLSGMGIEKQKRKVKTKQDQQEHLGPLEATSNLNNKTEIYRKQGNVMEKAYQVAQGDAGNQKEGSSGLCAKKDTISAAVTNKRKQVDSDVESGSKCKDMPTGKPTKKTRGKKQNLIHSELILCENVSKKQKNILHKPAERRAPIKTFQKKQALLNNTTPQSNIPIDLFGFNSEESDDDCGHCNSSLTKFDSSKPFRLALYVHPSKRLRTDPGPGVKKQQAFNPVFDVTNVSNISSIAPASMPSKLPMTSPKGALKNVPMTSTPNRSCVTLKNTASPIMATFKVPFASTPMDKKKKLIQPKITSAFQPCPRKTRTENAEKKYTSFFETSDNSIDEHSTEERKQSPNSPGKQTSVVDGLVRDEPLFPKTNRRRSYVKKSRHVEVTVAELSSDEIIKYLENPKKKKKAKKNEKEEEEFEKWSKSINSEFDEVEKFEVSFT